MKNEAIPRLRFKGFHDKWNGFKLGQLMNVSSSKRVHKNEWTNTGIRFLRARDIIANKNHITITDPLFISPDIYDKYSKVSGIPKPGDLLVTGVGTVGVPLLVKSNKPFYFKDGNIIWFHNHKLGEYFLYYYFFTNKFKKYMKAITGVGTVATYTITAGRNTPINIPTSPEQRQIGIFFATLDHLIQLQQKKVTLLKRLKKAYLQKLFPRKNETTPRIRFKGFHGKWEKTTFKNILDYEQPNKYRIHISKYKSRGIPVLTANKSFILGYTNERNIYNKGNCIIFDDFTLNNKYVNFPFMVKSSAIKILTSKNSCLYFDYELLNITHLIYEGHKRHYISIVQNTDVLVPSLSEQKCISKFLMYFQNRIRFQVYNLHHLRKLKKAYLQKMFC